MGEDRPTEPERSRGPHGYAVETFWSDEDEGFIAIAPELPGSSAFGETADAARAELAIAIPAWISACRRAGNPVPVPPSDRTA